MLVYTNKQTFHTRRITLKRVTSLRCPSPQHSFKATQLLAKLSTSCNWGTRVKHKS